MGIRKTMRDIIQAAYEKVWKVATLPWALLLWILTKDLDNGNDTDDM